jgi:hypothetical protein
MIRYQHQNYRTGSRLYMHVEEAFGLCACIETAQMLRIKVPLLVEAGQPSNLIQLRLCYQLSADQSLH